MLEVTAQITLKKKSLAFTMVNTYLHRFQSAVCWGKNSHLQQLQFDR